ncbi:MAG: hypothetical protein JWO13_278 [Acidobacteriales bacterium]|nr:hypothetical protein [Terriglobales bacterium]
MFHVERCGKLGFLDRAWFPGRQILVENEKMFHVERCGKVRIAANWQFCRQIGWCRPDIVPRGTLWKTLIPGVVEFGSGRSISH